MAVYAASKHINNLGIFREIHYFRRDAEAQHPSTSSTRPILAQRARPRAANSCQVVHCCIMRMGQYVGNYLREWEVDDGEVVAIVYRAGDDKSLAHHWIISPIPSIPESVLQGFVFLRSFRIYLIYSIRARAFRVKNRWPSTTMILRVNKCGIFTIMNILALSNILAKFTSSSRNRCPSQVPTYNKKLRTFFFFFFNTSLNQCKYLSLSLSSTRTNQWIYETVHV